MPCNNPDCYQCQIIRMLDSSKCIDREKYKEPYFEDKNDKKED